jgi:hypothetical protein
MAAAAALALLAIGGLYAFNQRQQRDAAQRNDEVTLRAQLAQMRGAIAQFKRETGRHPKSLGELVPKHLPAVPRDPFTGSTGSWLLVTEDVVVPNADFSTSVETTQTYVIDVQSGAGTPYADY